MNKQDEPKITVTPGRYSKVTAVSVTGEVTLECGHTLIVGDKRRCPQVGERCFCAV
jgi:hypothetical protein